MIFRKAEARWLGLISYQQGLEEQERVRLLVAKGESPGEILMMEHHPVYTLGRRASPEDLLMPGSFYEERGIQLVEVGRGGRATYHGPGQLIVYPVLPASSVPQLISELEEAVVGVLSGYGVSAWPGSSRGSGQAGVWVGERKIASIGLRIAGSVFTHGMSVNLDMDMQPWGWINPCGLGAGMTSLREECGRTVSPRQFAEVLLRP